MAKESVALFASPDQRSTAVGRIACVALAATADIDRLDRKRDAVLVLQRVRAVGDAGGPYAVYIGPAGTDHLSETNRTGYFSLYSVQQRSDSQELSFAVKASLLSRLLKSQPASSRIQVCVRDTEHTEAEKNSPSITFDGIVLVQP